MPDVNSNTPVQPVSASPDASAGADPLANLYKMSTTAGLGSQDYVAISGTAVTAALLGLASFLALLGAILYVIPIAALICSIAALRQIRQSNGTQTGSALAIIGLLLSLGIGGYAIGSSATTAWRDRQDERLLRDMTVQLAENVKNDQWDAAYDLFSDRFHQRVSKQAFAQSWQAIKTAPVLGGLKAIEWNGVATFDNEPTSGLRVAISMLKITFDTSEHPIRREIRFRKSGDRWYIEDIQDLFPGTQQQQPGGPPPGMPPMGM